MNLRFQVGGTIQKGSFYITRSADEELLTALLEGTFCYVLAPRQIGKSSLKAKTAQKILNTGIKCVTIDLQRLGSQRVTDEQWYYGLVAEISKGLKLVSDPEIFWKSNTTYSPPHRWTVFLEGILREIADQIIIFIDEIDSVLSLPFPTDDFFASIRGIHEKEQHQRITFCLIGVATPNELMRNKTRTPFNIGQPIKLTDFTYQELNVLIPALSSLKADADKLLFSIFEWTDGHPYMTLKICEQLQRLFLKKVTIAGSEIEIVTKIVEDIFLNDGRTEDSNLSYAEKRLDEVKDSSFRTKMLEFYKTLLINKTITSNPLSTNLIQAELKLSGIIAERNHEKVTHLKVRNKIFETVFNLDWVKEKESQTLLSAPIKKWLDSNKSNEFLLKGQALQDALYWAVDRELPQIERKFLFSSQQFELKQTESLLARLQGQKIEEQAKLESNQINTLANYQLENKTLNLVNRLLSKHSLVAFYFVNQYGPYVDGEIILKRDNKPIGKLEVQIKTLPDEHSYKYLCETSFIYYCENAQNPVLFLGVDLRTEKIYWVYFDSAYIESLNYKEKTHEIIKLKSEQFLDRDNTDYFEEWEKIVQAHILKIKDYDKIKDNWNKLKQLNESLMENFNQAINKKNEIFIKIHRFLDRLNSYLDNEFEIVKKVYYPDCWKLGLAYSEYNSQFIRYFLYPISADNNDVQIKEVDEKLEKKFQQQKLPYVGHFKPNPIDSRPEIYAKEIIRKKLDNIIKNKFINHTGNDFLALEYIIAFIDKFRSQMGLETKEVYNLAEVQFAFYVYLPVWVEEAVKIITDKNKTPKITLANILQRNNHSLYLDPSVINSRITSEEKKIIEQAVQQRLSEPKVNIQYWEILGNTNYPFSIFIEFLSYLKNKGANKVNRVYKPKDYSLRGQEEGWHWQLFNPKDAEYNLRQFFSNLYSAYNQILHNNFPLLENQLSFLNNANKVIVVFHIKDKFQGYQDSPGYTIYFVKSDLMENTPIFEILSGEESDHLKEQGFFITYKNKTYELLCRESTVYLPIYNDIPMFTYIYEILNEKLNEYFKENS